MSEQADRADTGLLDSAKLVLAAAILIGGVVGYYWFTGLPTAVRILMVLAGVGLGLVVMVWSTQGRAIWDYVQGSRVELRKMVWPTRQETVQTTLVVIVFVILLGIFFWLVDMLLAWATRYLTGQGG